MYPSVCSMPLASLRTFKSITLHTAKLVIAVSMLASTSTAYAEEQQFEAWLHGTSLMGDVKYPKGFKHFDYVNPDAPKGGEARMAFRRGYDSFNDIIAKGQPAIGMYHIYDTLMTTSYDEISSEYGLLAESTYIGPDFSYTKFRLRSEARWHDGTPISADDVIWSFEQQRKLNPKTRFYYQNVASVEKTGNREVTFTFDQTGNRELPHIVGQLRILPKHWWTGKDADGNSRNIEKSTLEPPLGSGPYKVHDFVPGKYVVFERVDDYWAKDLNVNVGSNNFDKLRIEFFRDVTVMFETFKAGGYDWHRESTAKVWARGYDFPAAKDGRIVKQEFPSHAHGRMLGFVPNLRRSKFQDMRVRMALNYVFNFEEMNRTLFFDQYQRINSYFFGTELASSGKPSTEEMALLDPLRDKVPATVFEANFENPVYKDRKDTRRNLQKALDLFKEAGWVPDGTSLVNRKGEAFEIELLLNGGSYDRVALRFQSSLARVGIKLAPRMVDSSQFINRIRNRDFDMIIGGWGQSLSPGNEQRAYFGSKAADMKGSRNFAGIRNEAVDALIEKIIFAKNRKELITASRAMDRVLLANHYVVPGWSNDTSRVARWDKFGHPETLPLRSVGFPEIWWWDEQKAQAAAKD